MSESGSRAIFGFAAAAISVLTLHQTMWALLHFLNLPGLGMPPPYPTAPVPPRGVPRIVDLAFWGGLYDPIRTCAAMASSAVWLDGLILGIIAALVGFFVVAPLKGAPIGGGWIANSWVRSLLINGFWGVGVGSSCR